MSRYGSREISNVVVKEISTGKPVLYLETLTTSSTEVTADTTYARGGRGNSKRVAWDSNKDVVYNMEDALISPESLAMLAGSELKTGAKASHKKETLILDSAKKVTLAEAPSVGKNIFVFKTAQGYDIGEEVLSTNYTLTSKEITFTNLAAGDKVIVDYYFNSPATTKSITIAADKFPGYYTLEAETLFRKEEDGEDYPALFTMPKIKIQPNFTISNASDGDPSVFSFNCDVFPDENNELVVIDILED